MIPKKILNSIKEFFESYKGNKKIVGYGFAQNLIKDGFVTGHQLKKLKNVFKNTNDITYSLIGGQEMSNFVNQKLDDIRKLNDKRKALNDYAGKSNAYRKTHTKNVSPLSESFIIFFR